MVGAAVDYSRLTLTKAKLQSAADAAALAGASAMWSKVGQVASVQEAAATAAATAVADGQAPNAQETVTATAAQKSVYVKLAQSETVVFGGLVGKETSLVSAASTAVYNEHKPCVTVLEPSATGLQLNTSATVNSNCKLHVNSTSNSAIQMNTLSKIKA